MEAELWQFFLAGLVVGGIFALIAAGFVLVYQVSGIINFAQGEFAMIGAMTAASLAGLHWPLWAAALAAVAAAAAIGGCAQAFALRPARGHGTVTLIFITLGLDVALRGAALFVWGTNPILLQPFTAGAALTIGTGTIPPQALWVFAADIAIVLALYIFFRRTYLGAAVRAAMANPSIARVFGMPLERFAFWSFVAAAVIGAIGGVVIAPITGATYDMGLYLGLNGFVAAILGGLDSLAGALVGGFVLGVVEKMCGGLISSGWEQGIAFVILLIVLVARPQGLLGRTLRRA
ncbi:MAG: branched-chain amino acid ABC transporter permease [Candidatus Eremiobacteraeota bacterium]|nr:branched-chain amino acid ABC transporter permease [Candidatus Eremiobacteraeota bacterium]